MTHVDTFDWRAIDQQLDLFGAAAIGPIFSARECDEIRALYSHEEHFRKHVIMGEHGYGRGEYRYFKYPLPDAINSLRESIYPRLAAIANRWNDALRIDEQFPATHEAFKSRCHAAGQIKPTPLILKYEADDFNCLHQDVYGAHVFPLQLVVLLSRPGVDFTGGEFTLTEQRPRMQPRVEIVPLAQGTGVIFPVRVRPVKGTRGYVRAQMKHGVARVLSGVRFTAGILFHDAK